MLASSLCLIWCKDISSTSALVVKHLSCIFEITYCVPWISARALMCSFPWISTHYNVKWAPPHSSLTFFDNKNIRIESPLFHWILMRYLCTNLKKYSIYIFLNALKLPVYCSCSLHLCLSSTLNLKIFHW